MDDDGPEALPRDFTVAEIRVLGCLIEKERATPQNYPLTLNALRTACNQSSNRDPVLELDDHTVEAALASLRERGLTRIVYSTSNRAAKYRHVLDEQLRLDDAQLAALCVLFLRGPQTVGEIKGRSERLYAFRDLSEVQETIDRLATHPRGALAMRLERRPGQKDARFVHLFDADLVDVAAVHEAPSFASAPVATVASVPTVTPASAVPDGAPSTDLARSLAELRDEVVRLRDEVDRLRAELAAFKSAFD